MEKNFPQIKQILSRGRKFSNCYLVQVETKSKTFEKCVVEVLEEERITVGLSTSNLSKMAFPEERNDPRKIFDALLQDKRMLKLRELYKFCAILEVSPRRVIEMALKKMEDPQAVCSRQTQSPKKTSRI